MNPRFSFSYNHLGSIYKIKGNYHLSEMYYEKAIESNPFNAEAHNNPGVIYRGKGQLSQAEAILKRAKELAPELQDT